MKLTFEHGLDDFRWDSNNQPAPGKRTRDVGIRFWLDGELLEAKAKSDPAARELYNDFLEKLQGDGMTVAQIRDYYQQFPHRLPDGIELG